MDVGTFSVLRVCDASLGRGGTPSRWSNKDQLHRIPAFPTVKLTNKRGGLEAVSKTICSWSKEAYKMFAQNRHETLTSI